MVNYYSNKLHNYKYCTALTYQKKKKKSIVLLLHFHHVSFKCSPSFLLHLYSHQNYYSIDGINPLPWKSNQIQKLQNLSVVQYYKEKIIHHFLAWFTESHVELYLFIKFSHCGLKPKRLEQHNAHPPQNPTIIFKMHLSTNWKWISLSLSTTHTCM